MKLNSAVVDAVCESRGISNRQLAKRIGKTPQFVLRLRRHERTASLGTIQGVADALDLPLEVCVLPHEPVKQPEPSKRS